MDECTIRRESKFQIVVTATEKALKYWMARHLGTFTVLSSQLIRYASIYRVSEMSICLGANKAYFNTAYN